MSILGDLGHLLKFSLSSFVVPGSAPSKSNSARVCLFNLCLCTGAVTWLVQLVVHWYGVVGIYHGMETVRMCTGVVRGGGASTTRVGQLSIEICRW